jgi:hypothetical protein
VPKIVSKEGRQWSELVEKGQRRGKIDFKDTLQPIGPEKPRIANIRSIRVNHFKLNSHEKFNMVQRTSPPTWPTSPLPLLNNLMSYVGGKVPGDMFDLASSVGSRTVRIEPRILSLSCSTASNCLLPSFFALCYLPMQTLY